MADNYWMQVTFLNFNVTSITRAQIKFQKRILNKVVQSLPTAFISISTPENDFVEISQSIICNIIQNYTHVELKEKLQEFYMNIACSSS